MRKSIKIGSQFSGVGAFEQSLKRLGIEYDNIYAADIDKYARQTYLLNFEEPKYYVKDVYDTPVDEITSKYGSLDLAMFSPPCQSFSLAGKRKGEDSKNGILFYNSHEFIKKNMPRYFIFENVKGLLSDDSGKTFQRWVDYLGGKSANGNPVIFPHEESVPYHVYYQILNAKHYGVPQNRERIFIIGIRDDADNEFSFPKPFHLVKRLKDVLESEVDEKYFLSDKMIDGLIKDGNKKYINQDTQASKVFCEEGESPTISAGTHGYSNGYVETQIGTWRTHEDGRGFRGTEDNNCPTIPARAREDGSGQPVIKISNEVIQLNPSTESGGKQPYQHNRVYDVNGVMTTLDTDSGRKNVLINDVKIGAILGRNPENPLSRKSGLPTEQMLEINESGVSNALTTVQKDNVVVIPAEIKIIGNLKGDKGHNVQNYYDVAGISPTVMENHGNVTKVVIPANNSKGYDIAQQEEDSINFSNPNSETRRGRVGKGVAQTLDTACNQGVLVKDNWIQGGLQANQPKQTNGISPCLTSAMGMGGGQTPIHNYQQRIRRLTPKECFRLMDFNEDFKWDVSDSQAYKQAGNSIVVNVLCEIIKKLKL